MSASEGAAEATAKTGGVPGPRGGDEGQARAGLPRAYVLWLVGILVSIAGDAVFYFALGWAASKYGGTVAGLTLSAITLPRVLLLLLGGAVSDRVSARRVLITGDAAMLVFSLVLAAVAYSLGAPPLLLIATGVAVGVVDAFYLPASGSMPRRLVSEAQLPRALSLRQVGGQVINMGGAPLAGVLVGLAGFAGAAAVNAVTFAFTLIVLISVRPQHDVPPAPRSDGLLKEALNGVKVAFSHPVLRPGLWLTGAAAGFLLPVMSLLVPLLAREEHWSAGSAGLVLGAQGVGMVAVTLVVVKRGPLGRPGLLAACALVLAGAGVLGLGLAPGPTAATAAGLLIGVGNGTFSAHIAPLILASSPDTHLSRIQAVLVLVQSVALLLMNNVLGALVDLKGATAIVVACAVMLIGVGLAGLTSGPLRNDRTGLVRR
ncbi:MULTISPECIES: MFS transporter [unclassified Streptomyces]|uniref:MFS transporter n=1 Tax=unclassified Streptomyces TaxID=2593676 RepID=UPI000DBABCD4|nr:MULTISPECIES: MFS transporter [unclassified Streptomyces]MYT69160.1 MFS transporter [Streptomyces sp. SID8367]RAJ82674.1 putative MFS family arabinose efflux permease [Streptomyces sp. PsTaAH-137]